MRSTFTKRLLRGAILVPVVVPAWFKEKKICEAKSVWPTPGTFVSEIGVSGKTEFDHSSWYDFITYKDADGSSSGHVTPYALAKNYLEISVTNLFRSKLGIDHVNMERPDWAGIVFFMRYQEIKLNASFYELLSCPRSSMDKVDSAKLTIESRLVQVGNSSFLIEQDLVVGEENVGTTRMQVCCINRELRKLSRLPESFLDNPEVVKQRQVPRPNFPASFPTEQKVGQLTRCVFMSDTDENDHLNEAGYLRFVLDACHILLPSCEKATKVKSLKGLYRQEVREGDFISISLYQNEQGAITAVMSKGETIVFESQIELY